MITNQNNNPSPFANSPLHGVLGQMQGYSSDEEVEAVYLEAKRLIQLGASLNSTSMARLDVPGHSRFEVEGTPLYFSLMYEQASKLTALLMRLRAENEGSFCKLCSKDSGDYSSRDDRNWCYGDYSDYSSCDDRNWCGDYSDYSSRDDRNCYYISGGPTYYDRDDILAHKKLDTFRENNLEKAKKIIMTDQEKLFKLGSKIQDCLFSVLPKELVELTLDISRKLV